MEENQNTAPKMTWTPIPPKSSGSSTDGPKHKRPILISVMSVLSVISILLIIISLVNVSNTQGPEASGRATFMSLPLLLICLGVAIGGWRGKRYGWWSIGVYAVYSIAKSITVFITTSSLVAQLTPELVTKQIFSGVASLFWGTFLCYYIFRKNVREYFDLLGVGKRKQILALAGIFLLVLFGFLSQALPLITKN
jgi:hypothetical protein